MGNAIGCGKKEQADTASPTPATHLTSPERPQASSGQSEQFLKYLKPREKYLSPEEVARKKATPEGRGMLQSQLLSGYVTKRMLLKRGVRDLQRTKRTRDRAKRAMTRKARRQIRGGGTRRYRRRRGGKRRRTRRGGRRRRR